MKNNIKILLLFLLLYNVIRTEAQELNNIIPLSPNAASIAKYGEIPVSYFTGVPNISVPIYTIESGDLSLPLSLSYHAGGNKVETVASWVGLGWSLTSIPSISRSVRGIPDNASGGYFTKVAGKSVREYWESSFEENQNTYLDFIHLLKTGEADSEPDIFYYNLPNENGKFIYNQELNKFTTLTKSNTKITLEGEIFTIITQTGVKYFFNEFERNQTLNSSASSQVITSWYASKIIAPNKTDSISLTYSDSNESYRTLSPITKFQFIRGASNGVTIPNESGSVTTNNLMFTKVINRIDYNNGYIIIKPDSKERKDLKGGYSLDSIKVYNKYNKYNKLVKQFHLEYKYLENFGYHSSIDIDSEREIIWLLLDKIETLSTDLDEKFIHQFYYNSTMPLTRTSAAQDYWGYYNGADENKNLIPFINIPTEYGNVQVQGANRQVNPSKSDFGILNKIVYPTGGYTEFEFENNEVDSSSLVQPNYTEDYSSCSADDFLDSNQELLKKITFEQKPFEIDNKPDPFLNGNNPAGGAYVRIEIDQLGCDLNGHSGTSASLTVQGISNNIMYYINMNTDFYLPNGKYKLVASFDQDPPNYRNYIFIAKWFKCKEQHNYFAGGLRVKEIRNYSNDFPNNKAIVKRYKYTVAIDSSKSSGDVFSKPNFCFTDIVANQAADNNGNAINWDYQYYLRIRSFSNTQQISHSGSFVGYKNVIEETIKPDETGFTEYKYSHSRDITREIFPYPPAYSQEFKRGQLLQETNYKCIEGKTTPVRKKNLNYTDTTFYNYIKYNYYDNNFYDDKFDTLNPYSVCLKWGNNIFDGYLSDNYPSVIQKYEIPVQWSYLSKETVVDYIGQDSVVVVNNYMHDSPNHVFLTEKTTNNREGNSVVSKLSYPQDYDNVENIKTLKENNILAIPIETRKYQNGTLVSGTQKRFSDSGQLVDVYEFDSGISDVVFDKYKPYTFSPKASVTYYSNNKIKSVTKENNLTTYYAWAYNFQYPVVKIESASKEIDIDKIQSDISACVLTGKNNKSDIDSDLEKIIDCVSSQISSDNMVNYYTYCPLIGMTTQTDPNGVTTYYEYDGLGRLKYVLDANRNIISSNSYQYKNHSITEDNCNLIPITVSTSGGGTINPSGTVNVVYGSSKTFKITPNTGYHITDVKIDEKSQDVKPDQIFNINYTFTDIIQSHSIHADFIPNSINLSVSSLNFHYSSNLDKTITISSNVPWTINNSENWISTNLTSGNGVSNLTITCKANDLLNDRSGIVSIIAEGITREIKITQEKSPKLILSLNTINSTYTGKTTDVYVDANIDWNVTAPSWIEYSMIEGSGIGSDGTVTEDGSPYVGVRIICPAYNEVTGRSGNVIISGDQLNRIINVSQEGAPATLNLAYTSWKFPYNSSLSKIMNVNSNTSWTISENIDWISLNKTSGSGNSTFEIYCTENTTTYSRSGTITLTAGGITKTLSISQDGKCILNIDKTFAIIEKNGYPQTSVNVTYNSSWVVTKSDPWIQLSVTSGSGNGSFNITAIPYGSNTDRTGIVTVTAGDQSIEIDVLQKGSTSSSGSGGPIIGENEDL